MAVGDDRFSRLETTLDDELVTARAVHHHGAEFHRAIGLHHERVLTLLAGLHRRGDSQIYVSRGTGYWGPPMRLGAPPEITEIRLEAAQDT